MFDIIKGTANCGGREAEIRKTSES